MEYICSVCCVLFIFCDDCDDEMISQEKKKHRLVSLSVYIYVCVCVFVCVLLLL